MSVYLGLGQYILGFYGGYINNVCAIYQPKSVNSVLRNLFIPIPLALAIISSIFVYFYPINDSTVKKNTIQLKIIENSYTSNGKSNGGFEDEYQKKSTKEKY
jgi:Na+/melibiose symporter-like transporter